MALLRPSLPALALVSLIGVAVTGPHARPSQPKAAAPTPQVFSLEHGPGCPRRLPAGGDVYEIDLPADTYLHASFAQIDTDIEVTVFAPGHRELYKIDSPNGRQESEEVRLVSGEAGRYRLVVTSTAGQETYCPQLRDVRRPSLLDRHQAAADQDLYLAPALSAAEQEERYRRAIPLFAETGDPWRQAVALLRLARLLYGGRCGDAIAFLKQAEGLFEAKGDRRLELVAQVEEGKCYSALFDFDRAQKTLGNALALARDLKDVETQATTLHELGLLFQAQGETWQALDSLRKAIALWHEIPGAEEKEANSLTAKGWVYASTGDWGRAFAAHQSALKLRKLSSPGEQAVSALQIGAVLLHTNPLRAGPYVERAWLLLKEDNAPHDHDQGHNRAATLNGMGRVLNELGRHEEARQRFQEALHLYSIAPADGLGQATTWINLGTTRLKLNDRDGALESFDQALKLGEQMRSQRIRVRALLGLSQVELLRHHLLAAQKRAQEALKLCEDLRTAAVRTDLQTSYLAENVSLYHLLISILMEQHRRNPKGRYDQEAFEHGEQTRARALLDALGESRESAGIPTDLRRKLQTLHDEIDSLARQQDRPRSVPTFVEQRLAERLEQLNDLKVEIRQSQSATPSPPPHFNAEEARRLIDPDTLLLEYSLGKQSYLWAVSADAVKSFPLSPGKELEPLLRTVAQQLATVEGPTDDSLRRLSRLLLGCVAGLLGQKRLLIAADGGAQYLPFAALPDPNDPPGSQQLLIDHHEIDYVPSLTVVAELRARRAERTRAPFPLAILASPVFNAWDERLRPGADRVDQESLVPLPYSEKEAKRIAALLPPGKAFMKLGFEASRELVTNGSLKDYRILHFASHGRLDADHPELSALVLSRFDSQGKSRDGYLRVSDLQYLDLPADLVVLGACKTALGRETPGEGLVGLPQAFLIAGASSVVVSLWKVDDASTADLMTELYRHLLQKQEPPGQALHEAQLATRRKWKRPYYWAPFVLQGDWR